MPVIDIKISISNNETTENYETKAIIQNNIIKYKEKDNTIVKYNLEENILNRENTKLRLNYIFKLKNNTIGKIFSKELNKEVSINIFTNKIQRKYNNIIIEYEIDNINFIYRIEEIKWVYIKN